MPDYTIGDMIAKQQELKAFIEAEEKSLAEWLKPYKEARDAIQVACGVALQTQGLQNFKSDEGTAYLRHSDGIKVDNKAAFLQFVRGEERFDMLDIGCLVDPIREYQTQKGDLPPGIVSQPSVTCIIRK
jgi:hypothetical protein